MTVIRRGTINGFHSEDEARAAVPEGAYDVEVTKIDHFHLETVRQDWPDPDPPAYPKMAANVDAAGYLTIYQASYTIESHDQDEFCG